MSKLSKVDDFDEVRKSNDAVGKITEGEMEDERYGTMFENRKIISMLPFYIR